MAGKSDYLENKILNYIFNGAAFTPPTDVYIALFTSAPSDAGGGTEVSGGSYGRAAIPCDNTEFPVTTTGVISNANPFNFATATAGWGTVVAFGIFDALVAGNLLYWGLITPNKLISNTDTISVSTGQLQISED